MELRLSHVDERHLLFLEVILESKAMKPSLFDCLFVVMYASVSVLANEESISNTTERSAKDKSSDKEDAQISICILLAQR